MRRLLLCVMLLGCSKETRPVYPEPTPPTSIVAQGAPASVVVVAPATKVVEAKPAQYVSAMESLSGVFLTGKDCAAISGELSAAFEANRAAITGATPELMQELNADEALRLRLRAVMSFLMGVSMKCQGDAAFQSMISSISPK